MNTEPNDDPMTAPTHPTEPPPLDPPLADHADFKSIMEALLRRPAMLAWHLADGKGNTFWKFILMTVVSLLLFGFVLGSFAKHEQLWAAPLKITAGLAFASVICFPSLYIFATLAGARIGVGQLAACFAGALALAGLLLLGFAPAIWIFAESTDSFGFMGALALGAWCVALWFGQRFLTTVVRATGGGQKAPLTIWGGIFLLVCLQMTTSLRPILGRSDDFLIHEKKFFLQHWNNTMGKSLPKTLPPTLPVK